MCDAAFYIAICRTSWTDCPHCATLPPGMSFSNLTCLWLLSTLHIAAIVDSSLQIQCEEYGIECYKEKKEPFTLSQLIDSNISDQELLSLLYTSYYSSYYTSTTMH